MIKTSSPLVASRMLVHWLLLWGWDLNRLTLMICLLCIRVSSTHLPILFHSLRLLSSDPIIINVVFLISSGDLSDNTTKMSKNIWKASRTTAYRSLQKSHIYDHDPWVSSSWREHKKTSLRYEVSTDNSLYYFKFDGLGDKRKKPMRELVRPMR